MKSILSLLVLTLMVSVVPAQAGVLKGAAEDVKVVAKVATFPARHPKKTAHGVKKATVKTAKAVAKL